MIVRHLLATVVALAAAAPSAPAQRADPIVGTWSVDYEVGRRVEDGEVTAIRGKGTLTIAPSGDSLLVTIAAPPRPDGSVPSPATFGARSADGTMRMVQKQAVRINMNGEISVHEVTLTWTLRANGDALNGTLQREMANMPEPSEPSPVTGTRIKS